MHFSNPCLIFITQEVNDCEENEKEKNYYSIILEVYIEDTVTYKRFLNTIKN